MHYTATVFVADGLDLSYGELQEQVRAQMAPFDQNLKVEEHEGDCPDLCGAARRAAVADRAGCVECRRVGLPDQPARVASRRCGRRTHTCETCGGTGRFSTTRNPRGKWDWWQELDTGISPPPRYRGQVGRRWDGYLLSVGMQTYAVVLPDEGWHDRGDAGLDGPLDGPAYQEWGGRYHETFHVYTKAGCAPFLLDYHS